MDDRARPASGGTRPNLAAVAARAGVSASTASLAFSGSGPVSDATRAKVLAAAAELNYAGPDPRARSLRRGRSGIIGVVIEDRLRDAFRDPINIAMLDGLADATGSGRDGASLLLLTETGKSSGGVDTAPVDAVVLIGCSTRLSESVETLRHRGIPIVAIEAEHREGVVAIDLDNREGSRMLATVLKDAGHERVAMVTLPLDPARTRGELTAERVTASTGWTAAQRILGVHDVFAGAGGWVAAGSFIEEGTAAALELLRSPAPPTAIIAQSDLLAVGVIRAAEKLGMLVPDDLSVVGFDGVRLDGIAPLELTTRVQPAFEKGRAAGRAVLELLDGQPAPGESFTSRYFAGNTVAPPREILGRPTATSI